MHKFLGDDMDYEDLQNELRDAVRQLIRNDRFLLDHAVREEAISHRIAVYLEPRFAEYNVDCEYNCDLDSESGRKRILYDDQNEARDVRPDIIVHHRGLNGPDHNQLVVEVKKEPSDDELLRTDREKLRKFTKVNQGTHFQYCCGALVFLGVKENSGYMKIEWYKDGKKEQEEKMER